MSRSLAFALAAVLAAPAAAAGKAKPPAMEKTMLDASFECGLPAGWSSTRESDGVTLLGPRDENKLAAQIRVRYVSPANRLYKNVDEYMTRMTKITDLSVPGWKIGKVEPASVAGRKSKRVLNDSSEFVPPGGRDSKEVPMREEHVVVPAAKGFYVLLYYVPRSLYAPQRPVFLKVLASFKPKL